MELSQDLLELLNRPSTCLIATTMPDGSPQMTQTWVDTDGEHVVINTVQRHQKTRNIARDPRVAVCVIDPDRRSHYWEIRGPVITVTTDGADAHIETLAQRYLGRAYPRYGGSEEVRVILTIRADKINTMG